LSPVVPQQLPTFTPVPHSRARFGLAADAEVPWDGYVDVSFRVSRFGHASDIDVLGSTGPLTEDIEKRLRRLVRGYPFRPRFIDGAPSTRDQVSIRYYFAVLN
jgi:outer membrane biosynthesis protein TonB